MSQSDHTETLTEIALAAVGLALFFLSTGCAAPPRPQVQAPPPVTPEPAAWQPVIDHIPASPPPAAVPLPRPQIQEVKDVIGKTAATLIYDPDRQYTLVCPALDDLLTVRLLPGERLQDLGIGNQEFWKVWPTSSTWQGEEVVVLLIRRGPDAPRTVLHVVTDRNIYQFFLTATGRGDNRSVRLIRFRDPDAELRKEERLVAAEERRRQKALEPRLPALNPETARDFQVTGDRVPWAPVRVRGDDVHTFVYLPANTGAAVPILNVMRDGEETRINQRHQPGTNGKGDVIVVDGTFNEAKLIGEGGIVNLTAGGN